MAEIPYGLTVFDLSNALHLCERHASPEAGMIAALEHLLARMTDEGRAEAMADGRSARRNAEGSTSAPVVFNHNVDGDTARCLHRVVRAMHDGHCPNCGLLSSASEMEVAGGHECPHCCFAISREEAKSSLEAFQPYMNRSLEVFLQSIRTGFNE